MRARRAARTLNVEGLLLTSKLSPIAAPSSPAIISIAYDGPRVDPWLRVHRRLGAAPIGVVPAWLSVSEIVTERVAWTGMDFRETGARAVPGALVPVHIDRAHDIGHDAEPHLWMHHRLSVAAAPPSPAVDAAA